MLDAYLKGEKEDLSSDDRKAITKAIQVIEAEAARVQAEGASATTKRETEAPVEPIPPTAEEAEGVPPPGANEPDEDGPGEE